MKLKLSEMYLGFDSFVPSMVAVIQAKSTLQHVDLSSAQLKPSQLELLSHELKQSCRQLKNINLSYNFLDYTTEQQAEHSDKFVENICEMISQAEILNHINLSGMRIPKEKLVEICDQIKRSDRISAIHLSNCGISSDDAFMLEILQKFGLDWQDVAIQRRSVNFDSK